MPIMLYKDGKTDSVMYSVDAREMVAQGWSTKDPNAKEEKKAKKKVTEPEVMNQDEPENTSMEPAPEEVPAPEEEIKPKKRKPKK